MRIAIVNDLAIAVAALQQVLKTMPDYQVVWVARDGSEAVTKCAQDTPDLILMDMLMPVMDGVEATRQIMKNSPCAILVVTVSAEKNVEKVYQAMGYGALDAVDTPTLKGTDSVETARQLLAKITRIGKLLKQSSSKTTSATRLRERSLRDVSQPERPSTVSATRSQSSKTTSSAKRSTQPSQAVQRSRLFSTVPLIAIGSSTGGPKALADILSKLPKDLNAAIAIVQHVDAQFSAGLVDWLNQQATLPVKVAVPGDRFERGTVLVAGTNDHLYVKPDLSLGYTPDPIDYPYRPSVDVFFKSLAQQWSRKGTAILLTGMGRDGAEGLSALRLKGWHTIAQNQASCVVYGMPKAAVELNAAVEVLPPDAIVAALIRRSMMHG